MAKNFTHTDSLFDLIPGALTELDNDGIRLDHLQIDFDATKCRKPLFSGRNERFPNSFFLMRPQDRDARNPTSMPIVTSHDRANDHIIFQCHQH
jgi:hypothetical protein